MSVNVERSAWRARNAIVVEVGAPRLELLAVTDPRRRSDDHSCAADVGAPAEVDVLAVEAHRRVEATEGAEQVGAHEEAGRGDGEHVRHCVVLFLIDLADVDAAGRLPEAVDVEADIVEDPGVAPT